jgi:RimJ/RimL family protein N-acetyltransferase
VTVEGRRIEPLHPSQWSAYRDARLRALADAPDAFGSTLEAERARRDGEWRSRVEAGSNSRLDLPLVARQGDRFVGLAWGKVFPSDPSTACLFQMWVDPELRGQGIGAAMVRQVIDWASALGATRLVLGVTEGDTPARRLYERAGFQVEGDLEPLRARSELRAQRMVLKLGSR